MSIDQEPHAKDAARPIHYWAQEVQGNVVIRVYCSVCGVTPQEWLMLQKVILDAEEQA